MCYYMLVLAISGGRFQKGMWTGKEKPVISSYAFLCAYFLPARHLTRVSVCLNDSLYF